MADSRERVITDAFRMSSSERRPFAIAILLIPLLSGCAGMAGALPSGVERSWSNRCFPGLERLSEEWSGERAIDCGFGMGRAGAACAHSAIRDGLPFRWGFDVHGVDSELCTLVARSADGTIRGLSLDSDGGGTADSTLRNASVAVVACKTLNIDVDAKDNLALGDTSACEILEDESTALADRVRSSGGFPD